MTDPRQIRRRLADEARRVAAAPHRGWALALLTEVALPLERKVRSRHLAALATRVAELDPSPAPFDELPPLERDQLVLDRVAIAIATFFDEEQARERDFADFSARFGRAANRADERRLLEDYLERTATDEQTRREDVAAIDRFLGLDALRERSGAQILTASLTAEVGLSTWGRACHGVIARAPTHAWVDDVRGQALRAAARAVGSARWPIRLAGVEAALAILAAAPPDAAARAAISARDADTITRLATLPGDEHQHPWLRARALELLILLDPDRGLPQLADVLLLPRPSPREEFLVRRLALGVVARRCPPEVGADYLHRLLDRPDPSEAVRLRVVAACAEPALALALPLVEHARAAMANEQSYRVRAMLACTIRQVANAALRAGELTPATQLIEELRRLLDAERVPFTQGVLCEELVAIAACHAEVNPPPPRAADGDGAAAAADPLFDVAVDALARFAAGAATFPKAAESAAAALEQIERLRDPRRGALTAALRPLVEQTPAGRARRYSIRAWPAAVRAAAAEPGLLGRVIAELTRASWGLDVDVSPSHITIRRGDRFRRRVWRIWHELRNPAPNKRQAFRHTIGRYYRGRVRAHPGNLDEATATTVPGERTVVDAEGSWCRHLPQVDDLLDVPVWRPATVRVASSLGVAELRGAPTLGRRLRARWQLTRHYRQWAAMRLASLRATEPRERRRYLEAARDELGLEVTFAPIDAAHQPLPMHASVATLFPEPRRTLPAGPVADAPPEGEPPPPTGDLPTTAALGLGLVTLLERGPIADVREWLALNRYYLTSPSENSQLALTAFVGGLTALFVASGYRKRQQIEQARRAVPLTIGGWGTRGKSGTERLKAAIFDGLGYNVFVKTTGCEAMFIHSTPLQKPVEIFIYRPYDKATIWEQMNMIRLASRLHADVFLWECMALNPRYVQLLQHDWMRDDLVTLTNAYPDHEDIQGPAGFNVAQVITEFIPKRSTLITSEMQYLPLYADRARARGTTMHAITDRDAEFIPDDVLDLFPYREHPRNIALVSRMAEELGLEREFAQVAMAQNVVSDLGVLKAYPACTVRGRQLVFVCGNSANERTGFINNWRRMKCDQLSMTGEPMKLVVTVVNNRADRVSRSEVFARILVRDIACDRHVLIGTNLKGLRGFIDAALVDYLGEQRLVVEDDFASADPTALPLQRLSRELGNLRIPPPSAAAFEVRLVAMARGAGRALAADDLAALGTQVQALFDHDEATFSLAAVSAAQAKHPSLGTLLDDALARAPEVAPAASAPPESLAPATLADVRTHALFELARMTVRARLERLIGHTARARQAAAVPAAMASFAAAYTELFWSQVDPIDDAGATGDQIIDRCARSVPPGSEVILMGTQNIKGTGLDFVYRWLALDAVVLALETATGGRLDRRSAALTELEAFADHGLVDTGLARVRLRQPITPPLTVDQEAARTRVLAKCDAVHAARIVGLTAAKQAGWQQKVAAWGEGVLDYLDSIHRTRAAGRIVDDLVAQRISHNRASIEMRAIVGRLKGGWLLKALRRKR